MGNERRRKTTCVERQKQKPTTGRRMGRRRGRRAGAALHMRTSFQPAAYSIFAWRYRIFLRTTLLRAVTARCNMMELIHAPFLAPLPKTLYYHLFHCCCWTAALFHLLRHLLRAPTCLTAHCFVLIHPILPFEHCYTPSPNRKACASSHVLALAFPLLLPLLHVFTFPYLLDPISGYALYPISCRSTSLISCHCGRLDRFPPSSSFSFCFSSFFFTYLGMVVFPVCLFLFLCFLFILLLLLI